jgi:phosphatidylethanolamine/phosphatidyl-N-methylethanolamine N-methyltransferase
MPANRGEFPLHDRPRTNTAGGARVDVALEKRQVERAYELYAPVYDFIFDWIFAPGRTAAVKQCGIVPSDTVLEVGIGTGLNLPLYPATCRLTGIDLSGEMLDKAVERVQNLAMPNVTLKVMDATSMDFGDNEFDKALATYTISAVPDPVAVLREMRRVVKPGGTLVILNHFRSERRVTGWLEDLVAPVCTRLGWKSNLALKPLLVEVGLTPELVHQVNMFNGWRLVKCVNRK